MILIAYASQDGTTHPIAERMARVLRVQGFRVALVAAADVTRVRDYTAVILGSDIYNNDWLLEASELLDSFQEELIDKRVWLFSDDPLPVQIDEAYPAKLDTLVKIVEPEQVKRFATAKANESATKKGYQQSDCDWEAVDRFVTTVAVALSETRAEVPDLITV